MQLNLTNIYFVRMVSEHNYSRRLLGTEGFYPFFLILWQKITYVRTWVLIGCCTGFNSDHSLGAKINIDYYAKGVFFAGLGWEFEFRHTNEIVPFVPCVCPFN